MIASDMLMTEQEELIQEGLNQGEMNGEGFYVDAVIDRIELYCPNGLEGRGFLTIWLTTGNKFTVELDPRYSRVVAILENARVSELGLNATGAGGWRSKSKLADAINAMNGYRVNESTVTAYVSQIDKLVKQRLRESVDSLIRTDTFRLLERRRGLGVRLAEGVTVEILNDAAQQPDR